MPARFNFPLFLTWLRIVAIPLFGPFLVRLLGQFLAAGSATAGDYYSTIQWAQRLLPSQIFAEASAALLSPNVTSVNASEL